MIFDTHDNVSWWLQIIAVALAIAILVCGGLLIGWQVYFGQITGEDYDPSKGTDINSSSIKEGEGNEGDELVTLEPIVTDAPELDPNLEGETIHPSEMNNLKSNIKSWMNTGEAVRDNNVTNILVIGMENLVSTGTMKSQDLSVNGRADAMVLVSINHITKKITLASLMRDQYCYLVYNNKGSFQKLHHALSYGGPALQIQMLERYYKIVIDNYVLVNFDSVMSIIDALGKITVDVTKEEASYLNNYCGFNISAGPNEFDGYHALIYMRIRKGNTGGDEGRVGRQRKVIINILNKAKSYGMGTMISVVNSVIPYVRTGLTPTEILGYATTALADGWLNYEIQQITLPDSSCAKGFTNSEDNLWYWKVDFPVAARKLQLALYGQSNIELASNRKSWL